MKEIRLLMNFYYSSNFVLAINLFLRSRFIFFGIFMIIIIFRVQIFIIIHVLIIISCFTPITNVVFMLKWQVTILNSASFGFHTKNSCISKTETELTSIHFWYSFLKKPFYDLNTHIYIFTIIHKQECIP